MRHIRMRIVLFCILLGLWLLLTGGVGVQELIMGGAVALIICLLPLPGIEAYSGIGLLPKKVWYSFVYFWVFLGAVVKSNLDVAFRVLNPKLPINPGIVKVTTKLTSPLGRLVLANSITLTPGTITVDIHGDELFIHWLSIEGKSESDIDGNTKKIVGGFEKYLEVIFG